MPDLDEKQIHIWVCHPLLDRLKPYPYYLWPITVVVLPDSEQELFLIVKRQRLRSFGAEALPELSI
jgi:hypothetical protein